MFEFLYIHHLHSVKGLRFTVLCFVNVPVLALTDLFKQNVIFNDFVH